MKQIVFMVQAIPPHTMRDQEQNGLPCVAKAVPARCFGTRAAKSRTKRTSLLSSFPDLCQVFSGRGVLASVCQYISVGLMAVSFLAVDRSLRFYFVQVKVETHRFIVAVSIWQRCSTGHSLFVCLYVCFCVWFSFCIPNDISTRKTLSSCCSELTYFSPLPSSLQADSPNYFWWGKTGPGNFFWIRHVCHL